MSNRKSSAKSDQAYEKSKRGMILRAKFLCSLMPAQSTVSSFHGEHDNNSVQRRPPPSPIRRFKEQDGDQNPTNGPPGPTQLIRMKTVDIVSSASSPKAIDSRKTGAVTMSEDAKRWKNITDTWNLVKAANEDRRRLEAISHAEAFEAAAGLSMTKSVILFIQSPLSVRRLKQHMLLAIIYSKIVLLKDY